MRYTTRPGLPCDNAPDDDPVVHRATLGNIWRIAGARFSGVGQLQGPPGLAAQGVKDIECLNTLDANHP